MSKSLEALDILYDGYQYGMAGRSYYDLIKQDLELLEQLKQQRDSLAINNGELCVKVTDLQKENQELKELVDSLNKEQILGVERIFDLEIENQKLKKAIEILKDKLNLYLDESISTEVENYRYYSLCADTYANYTQQEYELLKEVLE